MKLKSYLRGLGLGMIVTTIILVVAFSQKNTQMTDAQIMSRAYELGMVETSLYGNGEDDETEKSKKDDDNIETSGEGQVDPENNVGPTEVETTAAPENETTTTVEKTTPETTTQEKTTAETTTQEMTTAKPVETTTAKPVETTKATESETTTASNQYVTIVFEDISSATKASTLLYEAGIIQDIQGFNNYLTQKGLATKVGEGEFRFKSGMTFEEIAKIITRQN